MIDRVEEAHILQSLERFPAVGLIGARQVGKTTLAKHLKFHKETVYLDLERPSDLARLDEPEWYLQQCGEKLLILDEIHRKPEMFPLLRSEIDLRKQRGEPNGHFLILGSATPELLRQSSESLAGRIRYHEIEPLNLLEAREHGSLEELWLRGGFPDSLLAQDFTASLEWRNALIDTYLHRDIPELAGNYPPERMRRFWQMLAYEQGSLWRAERIGGSLGITGKHSAHYLEVLRQLFHVVRLDGWSGNPKKRLIKGPKVYLRDSGILHALLGLGSFDDLLGHPVCGGSWEGFVIGQVLSILSHGWKASHYRSSGGAEVDLILESPRSEVHAIEIKRSLTPKATRGFCSACEDVRADTRTYVIPKGEARLMEPGIWAVGLAEWIEKISHGDFDLK